MVWLSDEERFSAIEENLKIISNDVAEAAIRSGRSFEDIALMAVTKTVEPRFINKAIECGISLIGENKVQEFLLKEPELALGSCKAHLIGHLQSNKVRKIVGRVDTIQSVDTVDIAREIGKRSAMQGITTNVLLEVNVGNEDSKFGFTADELFERACEIAEIDGVCINGLMCVAPICEKESEIRAVFSNMRRMFIDIGAKKIDNSSMEILSMGMSDDFDIAVEEGANLIRLGTALFGRRVY